VYHHEIPGGQLSNLRQQAKALGLADDFELIEDMYAAADRILGRVPKVTPSSKVVGDLALHLAADAGAGDCPGLRETDAQDVYYALGSEIQQKALDAIAHKAATGEIAGDEELGGAEMHTRVSGVAEYLAEDDADGIRIARDLLARMPWNDKTGQGTGRAWKPPPRSSRMSPRCGCCPPQQQQPCTRRCSPRPQPPRAP
jgi:hypothetical protein